MGGSAPKGPSKEQRELEKLQKEKLAEERAQAERLKSEQRALMSARRSGSTSFLSGSEAGEKKTTLG